MVDKVCIVTSSTITDGRGEVIDFGQTIAVCRSREVAEYRLSEFRKKYPYDYGRRDYDYEIEVHEVED